MLSAIASANCCPCDTTCEDKLACPSLTADELPEQINFNFTGTASYLIPPINLNWGPIPGTGSVGLCNFSFRRLQNSNDTITVNSVVDRLVLSNGEKTREYFKYFPVGQRQTFELQRTTEIENTIAVKGNPETQLVSFCSKAKFEIVGIYVAPIKTVTKHVYSPWPNIIGNGSGFTILTEQFIDTTDQRPDRDYVKLKDYSLARFSDNECINEDCKFEVGGQSGFFAGEYQSSPRTGSNIPLSPSDRFNRNKLACGDKHCIAIYPDGTLWAWGYNEDGQLGNNQKSTNPVVKPIRIDDSTEWSSVACGSNFSFALKRNGDLYAWGNNIHGQLGLGDTNERLIPTLVGDEYNLIAAGGRHAIALRFDKLGTSNGFLYSWGKNDFGQLGLGNTTNSLVPKRVQNISQVAGMACGLNHTVIVARGPGDTNLGVWAWGDNSHGQVGNDGAFPAYNTPQKCNINLPNLGLTLGYVITAGNNHNALLTAKQGPQQAYVWGKNNAGQLGLGDLTSRFSPTLITAPVSGEHDRWITNIQCGGDHTIIITRSAELFMNGDEKIYGCGDNSFGQLGNGSSEATNTSFVETRLHDTIMYQHFNAGNLNNLTTFLACGLNFTIYCPRADFYASSYIWSWGDNSLGQLGNDSVSGWNGTYDSKLPNLMNLSLCRAKVANMDRGGRNSVGDSIWNDCLYNVFNLPIDACEQKAETTPECNCAPSSNCIKKSALVSNLLPLTETEGWFADIIIQPATFDFTYPTFKFKNFGPSKIQSGICPYSLFFFGNGSDITPEIPEGTIQCDQNFPAVPSEQEGEKAKNRFTSTRYIGNRNSNVYYAGGRYLQNLDQPVHAPLSEEEAWYDRSNFGVLDQPNFAVLPLLPLEDFANYRRSTGAQRIQYLVPAITDEFSPWGPFNLFPDEYSEIGPHVKEFVDTNYSLNPNYSITSNIFSSSPIKQNVEGAENNGLPYGTYKLNIATKSTEYVEPFCTKPCFGNEYCYDQAYCCNIEETTPKCIDCMCCSSKPTPGCPVDSTCQAAVCAVDPLCCSAQWDSLCANIALDSSSCNCQSSLCAPVCGNNPVSCFVAHSTPGCNDAGCCSLICGFEPSCCEDSWSETCVELAQFFCGTPPPPPEGQSQNNLLGGSGTNTGSTPTPDWCYPYSKYKGFRDINVANFTKISYEDASGYFPSSQYNYIPTTNYPYQYNTSGNNFYYKNTITTFKEQQSVNNNCYYAYYNNTCLLNSRPLHKIYSSIPLPPNGVLEYNERCNVGDANYVNYCLIPKINGEYVLPNAKSWQPSGFASDVTITITPVGGNPTPPA
jgi:alpha-tubulin suppressor-like RCC1 family protein